ncbi:hypothetical protein IL306_001146 [Fusarium sp. DS 682]|nr:hypothetical protein IL306_001146 [Fusarium sp. DS 682]
MVRTRKEGIPSTVTPRTSLERKSKRKRKRQNQNSEPELDQQSSARKRRKLDKKKEWWTIRRVIDEDHLLNPESGETEHKCFVEWETDSDGETYPNEWVLYKDLNAGALEEWEKEKEKRERERTKREAQRGETRNRRGLRDLTPRRDKAESPVISNRQQLQTRESSTQNRSRFDSPEQDVRPSRSFKIELEGTFSEEPVPSFISASSVDTESVSSGEFSRAPVQEVAVVLSKPDNFDPSEYQSVTTQDSSQRITELEDDDQRVAFASQLSKDTIPDSQDPSGHWDYQDCESQPAARPNRFSRSPEIPEDPPSVVEDHSKVDHQVGEVVRQKEAQSCESITDYPGTEVFRSVNSPAHPKAELSDTENSGNNQATTDIGCYTGATDHSDDEIEVIHSFGRSQNLERDSTEADTTTNDQILEEDKLKSIKSTQETLSSENESFETANSGASLSWNSQEFPVNQDQYGQDSVSVNQGSGEGQQVVQDHVLETPGRFPLPKETLGEGQSSVERSASSHHQSARDQQERIGSQSGKGDSLPQHFDKPTSDSAPKELSPSRGLFSSIKEIEIIVPDSQDHSSAVDAITASALALVSQAQVTPIASQVEIVPDSAATGSDAIPSHQPDHFRSGILEKGILLDSSLPSNQSPPQAIGETATSLRGSTGPHRTQKPQIYYSQPQGLYDSLNISSSLSSGAGVFSKAAQSISDTATHPGASSEPQASQEEGTKESQAAQVASQLSKPQLEDNIASAQGISYNLRPLSLIGTAKIGGNSEEPEKPRSTLENQGMERSASQPRDSAVDELKSYIDFGKDSVLTHVGDSVEENPEGMPYEPTTDEEPIPGASTGRLDAVVSSPEAVHQSQPVYSVDPWKPEALGTNPEAPVPSISPASIMANPHVSRGSSIRDLIAGFESEPSITHSIWGPDAEDDVLPGTISPAVISRSIEPVESAHTLNFPNQDSMPTEVESSGHSITMGQVPVERDSDVSSESSPRDDLPTQSVVTLPMQASRRPYYGEIIKDHKAEIQDFSRCFTGETPEKPSEELVQKITDLFDRLFVICDYPQDVIGTDLETRPSSELAKYCCDANPKFSFLFELMTALDGKEKEILIVVRSQELMRLLFTLTEAARIECSAESINQHTKFASFARITLALATDKFDPFSFDVIVGYDFHYLGSAIARQLHNQTTRKSPLELLLVTTYSIEHVRLHSLHNASELEVKNALLAFTVSAARYLEEPERGYGEPPDVAVVFANYIKGITDTLDWDPQSVPDDVLDIFENPGSQTQLLFTGDALYGTDLKRKHVSIDLYLEAHIADYS